MPKYTDEDIRNMSKITCKIAADYLGISPMAVSIGMRNDLLPIGFAIHNEEKHLVLLRMSISLFIKSCLLGFMDMPEN